MVSISELLIEQVRICLAHDGPEIWRSIDGGRRVLGPVNSPYSFLYVMVFEGPKAAEHLLAYTRVVEDADIDRGFRIITSLTGELGRPALLVEPIPPLAA